MRIEITDESETYKSLIDSVVKHGVLHHYIAFLTESELDVKQMREQVDYDDDLGRIRGTR